MKVNKKEYRFYAYKLHMVKEQEIHLCSGQTIHSSFSGSKLIKKVIRKLGQTDRENFVVLMLNAKFKPIGTNLVSIGTLTRSIVQPREIIKAALNMPCKALILGHNHPSGDPSPSMEDKLITLMVMASAHLFDLEILDHINVDMDSDAYLSFADEKIIEDTKQKVSAVLNQFSTMESRV
jgi:DNA repair protein RadC